MTTKSLIQRFYQIQEERIKTYKKFDEVFETYLASGPNYNFKWYREATDYITKTFAKLSDEVKGIETSLTSNNQLEASKILRKIQLKEKEKLEQTAVYQIKRQAAHEEGLHLNEATRDSSSRLKKTHAEICELMEEFKFESEEVMNSTEEGSE